MNEMAAPHPGSDCCPGNVKYAGEVYTCCKGPPALDRAGTAAPPSAATLGRVKAIVVSRWGGPEVLEVRGVPDPRPAKARRSSG